MMAKASTENNINTFAEHNLIEPRKDTADLPLIVFDDTCSLCNTSVGWVRRLDWRHQFNFMGYSTAATKYPEVAKTALGAGVQIRFANKQTQIGINAVRSILLKTPLGFVPGVLLFIPGIHFIANRVYKHMAANRPRACPIVSHRN
jgi:predicted DCC family thiol-disulfide oxidoreductase YuxK